MATQNTSRPIVLCDISNAQSTYVIDCVDTSLWNDRFITALAIRLAMSICSALVKPEAASQKVQVLQQMYKEALPSEVYAEEGWIAGESDATRLVIYNMALRLVGARMVSSIWEDMPEAVQCGVYWDRARRSVLRDFPYRFAVRRVKLIARALPEAYSGAWTHCYTAPDDMLKLLSIHNATDKAVRQAFSVEYLAAENVILCNVADAQATYTADVTATGTWDEKFTSAMATKLALCIAPPLIGGGQDGSSGKVRELAELYNASIPKTLDWEEGGWAATDSPERLNICNIALGYIGASMISSTTENVPEAVQCSLYWDRARRAVLRDHPYRFSTQRVSLVEQTMPMVYGGEWQYCYAFPEKALKILSVHGADKEERVPFSVEYLEHSKFILCNTVNAQATCTMDVEDISMWDEKFTSAMGYMLAIMICGALTKTPNEGGQTSAQKIEELSKMYAASLPNEQWHDEQWATSSERTKLGIFNMALGYIGSRIVSSVTENVPEAVQCNLYWDRARMSALRDYPYRFAQKRYQLVSLPVPDVYSSEWRYCYAKPDVLKITRVHGGNEEKAPEHYTMEGEYILCNIPNAQATCTIDVDDISLWDELFLDMMAKRLAVYIAHALQKGDAVQAVTASYIASIPQSEGQSNSEGRDSRLDIDSWLAARCS